MTFNTSNGNALLYLSSVIKTILYYKWDTKSFIFSLLHKTREETFMPDIKPINH